MFRLNFLFPIIAFFINTGFHPLSKKEAIVLLTNPRTGTNWMVGCLQYLTGRRCYYLHTRLTRDFHGPGLNFLELDVTEEKSPIYRMHYDPPASLFKTNNNKLIVMNRNFREIFIRLARANRDLKLNVSYINSIKNNGLKPEIQKFLKNYRVFEKWPEKDRIMISYEELLLNPRDTLKNLLDFLNESDEKLEEFLANIDTYKAKMLEVYSMRQRGWGALCLKVKMSFIIQNK